MLCQNCQLNEATIHLYTNMNGTKKQNDLCQNCYQIMKAGGRENLLGGSAANPAKNQSDNNFNPFDDLFGTLGNNASRANNRSDQSTPQTQSGRGGNGKAIEQAEINEDTDWIRILNAQLMYYFHIPEPSLLPKEIWAARVAELKYIRKKESGT